jgi:hypothetical protein
MVALAERCPTVGIVGSYQLSNNDIRWRGIPADVSVVSGRTVCRESLLRGLDVFGNPTSSLYRSDLIRRESSVFPHSMPHADTSACYKLLKDWEFGFVHEVLTVEGVHDRRDSTRVERLGMGNVAYLDDCVTYGPIYLSHDEFITRRDELLEGYYQWLGGCVLKLKGAEFWKFHRSRLKELGYPIQWAKVSRYALMEMLLEMRHPTAALQKVAVALKG